MIVNKDMSLRSKNKYPRLDKIMNLKSQLKIYLHHSGLTASQLAKKSSVPKQSISGWLSGNNPRDVRQVKKVADVFLTTVDHLMFGEGLTPEDKTVSLDSLMGDGWISGVFEVRLRRLKK